MICVFRASLFLLLMLISIPAHALMVPEKPGTGVYITDTVNLISEEDRTEINRISRDLNNELGIPIVVVSIDSLLNYTEKEYLGIELYSKALFNAWGIGRAAHNYGILLLVAHDDKIARIQFGGGWGFLYDDHAQRIMDEIIVPKFKKKAYSQGVKAGVVALDNLARTELLFLIDKTKVAGILLLLTAFCCFLVYLLILNIKKDSLVIKACFAGGIVFALMMVSLGNHLSLINLAECWIIVSYFALISTISLMVYARIYAKSHSVSAAIVQVLLLVSLVILLLYLMHWSASNHENEINEGASGGSADWGGGATGDWGD